MILVFLLPLTFSIAGEASADATKPAQVVLSEEERLSARSGEVVVDPGLDDPTAPLTAVVFVEASPKAVIHAVTDLPPRVDEIDSLTGLEMYRSGPHLAAKWTVDATVKTVDFYVVYKCMEADNWCSFSLDPTKDSDIPQADGAYVIRPEGTGVWLEYFSETEPPALIPPALRAIRRQQSAEQMLSGIKTRAEAVD